MSTEPVRTADGKVENFTIRIGKNLFRCECGCNVFHKPDDTRPDYFKCNSCDSTYESE